MQTSQLDVTVIVRTCGRANVFLHRALESIIAQTMRPAQIVVVNDEPRLVEIESGLARLGLQAIPLKYLPRDSGIHVRANRSAALNRGIAASTTRWIAFLDDDDTWTPQFLEKTASLLTANENQADFGGVVTQTLAVYERLNVDRIVEKRRRVYNPDLRAIDLASLSVGNRFTINSIVMRREVFATVGIYREDLCVLEDWEFNVRAAARYHFEVIPEALACYHIRPVADVSGNSSIHEHKRVAARIRNEWLRADLAAGRLGLGQLALAGEIRGLGAVLDFCRRWHNRIRNWIGGSHR